MTITLDQCGGNGPNTGSIRAIGFGQEFADVKKTDLINDPDRFMFGIRVCMNNDLTRIKGAAIVGSEVSAETGAKIPETVFPSNDTSPQFRREHCASGNESFSFERDPRWMPAAICPQRHIATSLLVHFQEGSSDIRSIRGISLKCRRVFPQSPATFEGELQRGEGQAAN